MLAQPNEWAFSAQFFIVSGPSGAGKTSFLELCASKMQQEGLRVGGFLAPDTDGRRFLRLLSTGDIVPFQINDGIPGNGSGESSTREAVEGVRVGNFVFSQKAFAAARRELHCLRDGAGGSLCRADWILIDEIGPLELRGEGLEPEIGGLLRAASCGELGPPQPRFLIVVRPSLRDAVEKAYGLDGSGLSVLKDCDSILPGSGSAEAKAAALVHIDVEVLDDPDMLIGKLVGLPHLL